MPLSGPIYFDDGHEGQIAEFVEDQQIGLRELVGEPSRLTVPGVGFEAVDQIDDVEETGPGTDRGLCAHAERPVGSPSQIS